MLTSQLLLHCIPSRHSPLSKALWKWQQSFLSPATSLSQYKNLLAGKPFCSQISKPGLSMCTLHCTQDTELSMCTFYCTHGTEVSMSALHCTQGTELSMCTHHCTQGTGPDNRWCCHSCESWAAHSLLASSQGGSGNLSINVSSPNDTPEAQPQWVISYQTART